MFNIFKKNKTEWQIKVRCVFFAPFREEKFCIHGKTRHKAFRLLSQLRKKLGSNGIMEFLSCEEVSIEN